MNPALIAGAVELAKFAGPRIGRWLGGEAGEEVAHRTAKAVTGTARAITGVDDVDEAKRRIQMDPELQARFEVEMADREYELERAYLADRQDARKRDVALRTAGYTSIRADVLALIAIVGLVGLVWMMVFVEIPAGPGRDILLMLSGALVSVVKDVYAFEFGSSRGSKEKDRWR